MILETSMQNRSSAVLVAGVLALATLPAQAAEIVVYGTVAAKAALAHIVPAFEQATGNKVTLRTATTGELADAIARGATVDVAILSKAALDDLAGKGKLDGASLVMVAKSGIGVAVKKGAPQPAIGTAEDFKRSLLAAKSIAYTAQGATGVQLQKIFAQFDITDVMRAKTVLIQKGTSPQAVGRGEAELALTQISEILDAPAAQLVGPLPAGVQVYSAFGAEIAAGHDQQATRDFLAALTSPAGKAALTAAGLETE
jgi:molybdate transport system substrate-binding protein